MIFFSVVKSHSIWPEAETFIHRMRTFIILLRPHFTVVTERLPWILKKAWFLRFSRSLSVITYLLTLSLEKWSIVLEKVWKKSWILDPKICRNPVFTAFLSPFITNASSVREYGRAWSPTELHKSKLPVTSHVLHDSRHARVTRIMWRVNQLIGSFGINYSRPVLRKKKRIKSPLIFYDHLIFTTSPVPLLQEICSDNTKNFNTDSEE